MDEGGVGALEPMEGRRLDQFLFQRVCVKKLNLHEASPYQQVVALSDPKFEADLLPPWERGGGGRGGGGGQQQQQQ